MFGAPPPIQKPGLMGMLGTIPMGQTQNTGLISMPQGLNQDQSGVVKTLTPPPAPSTPQKEGVNWWGVLADALAGAAGTTPMYQTMMLQKRQQDRQAQLAAANRQADFQDKIGFYDYQNAHPKPLEPDAFERSLVQANIKPGTPEWQQAYQSRIQHWNDPFINTTLPNGQFYSGPQSGLPQALGGGNLDNTPTVEDGYQYTPGPGGRSNQSNWKAVGGSVGSGTGGFPVTPSKLDRITIQSESGGDPSQISPKGAMGLFQVMPSTARNPGFGIKPWDGTPGDLNRVGQQYRVAMQKRYDNNLPKMWAAYNWGPGNLDNAIAQYGDNWIAHAPPETRNYIAQNMRAVRGN